MRRDFVDKGFENTSDRLGVPTLQSVLNNLYTGEQGVFVALWQFKACDYAWKPRNFIDATVTVCIGARRTLEGAAIGDIQHSVVVIVV